MRPEKFDYQMDLAFSEYFKYGKFDKFKQLKREIKRVWLKLAKSENDFRSGEETYGYDLSIVPSNGRNLSIAQSMSYISDRWKCAYRLKWLIDGMEKGYFK